MKDMNATLLRKVSKFALKNAGNIAKIIAIEGTIAVGTQFLREQSKNNYKSLKENLGKQTNFVKNLKDFSDEEVEMIIDDWEY